jgi:hypothetical protein
MFAASLLGTSTSVAASALEATPEGIVPRSGLALRVAKPLGSSPGPPKACVI